MPKGKYLFLILAAVFLLTPAFFALAQFVGPSQTPPAGGGTLQVDTNYNVGLGTSSALITPTGGVSFGRLFTISSSSNPGFSLLTGTNRYAWYADTASGTLSLAGSTNGSGGNRVFQITPGGTVYGYDYHSINNQNYYVDPGMSLMPYSALFSGKVGIGTTNPGQQLEVNGNALVDGSVYIGNATARLSSNGNGEVGVNYNNAGTSTNSFAVYSGTTASLFVVQRNGNVGVGTATPSYLLTASGGTAGGNALYVEANNTSNGTGAILQFNGSSYNGFLNVRANTAYPGGSAGINLVPYTQSNNQVSLFVDQNDSQKFKINVNQGPSFANFSGTTALTIQQNGYIGIGTTTPAYLLDVNGTSNVVARFKRFTSGVANEGAILVAGNDASNNLYNLYIGSSPTEGVVQTSQSVPLNLGVNGGVNLTISTSGYVGVGTTAPTTAGLVVTKNVSGVGIDMVGNRIANLGAPVNPNDAATKSYVDSAYVPGGTAGNVGGTGTSGYIPKWTSTSTIANSGIYQSGSNIGIGTTGPGALLDVEGTYKLNGTTGQLFGSSIISVGASGGDYGGGGLVQFASPGGTNLAINYTATGNARYTQTIATNGSMQWTNNAGNTVFYSNSGGNVGIGTTAPTTAGLVVSTNVSTVGIDVNNNRVINVGTPINAADAATKSYVDSAFAMATSTQYWTLSGSNLYPNSTAYNVGIGMA